MEKNNLPAKNENTELTTQSNKQNLEVSEIRKENLEIKRMELENDRFAKISDIQVKTLDTINNLSNNKLASQRLEAEARQTGIDNAKMFDALNKTIDKKFEHQDRAMDGVEKALDGALERWDKDIISKSLDKLAEIANTNPLGNIKKDIIKDISIEDFDDDDFMIEL